MDNSFLDNAPLGNEVVYSSEYSPSLLYPIPRKHGRDILGIEEPLPFEGADIWNAYELSWLDAKGKPCVAIGSITFPCSSRNIIESKSLKLYLNSFSTKAFTSVEELSFIIEKDLSDVAEAPVSIKITSSEDFLPAQSYCSGFCLDGLDVTIDTYTPNADFLCCRDNIVEESLFSHLLKTNCPKTGQPDWACIIIDYRGPAIDREGLLKYIVSFREHNDFHEQCVEKIFVDILSRCSPERLMVYARYTRRGGVDINPFRANYAVSPENASIFRQ
ncbi:MAG: NADPH-dependent 7-cyano-7-deazaguanine reductase QueF [Waddliaceae bacterium]|jgi:7-cyano-7-deazaguanine reductase|nr:NADPH-dependent 7-cyano-7-deazaguanine reductase QueF [Waddliaceae bacterium]MBT3579376.1 NADPH-dependent 7-cyano-7-deazaguanine reductase QueF [Waddliaceae bacterium]MBT4444866.1 NADPH-dependent 7-cyano-7-deazaguanine reductase QueF [Waddliaceae bacterium]MBT6928813.1 NADPH-dependent 7-cyano-7-deazaguanine reductase QueF [Waddliaceae bacterium]MBT7265139.1 NADPH-dependent 7-cyano-7-deazaguanine reductase QueF [Waddliaceae bacterium]